MIPYSYEDDQDVRQSPSSLALGGPSPYHNGYNSWRSTDCCNIWEEAESNLVKKLVSLTELKVGKLGNRNLCRALVSGRVELVLYCFVWLEFGPKMLLYADCNSRFPPLLFNHFA